jgi:serine/threonine protein kinase/Flp pilus assembly protein TadD
LGRCQGLVAARADPASDLHVNDRHQKIKELYLLLRDVLPGERATRLDSIDSEDASIRSEVESLLAADSAMPEDFLTQAMPQNRGPGFDSSNYRIIRSLGSGGMGEVWLAEQTKPVTRLVALKVMRWGLDSTEALARFDAECQALARMVHPGIAQLFGAGTKSDGRPCLAMEYVPGLPITEYCDQNHLNLRDRIELFRQLCLAVQHAHQNGVIHRDLKPSNILVAQVDGGPHVKIIDFGVAKSIAQPLTERTLQTELHHLIGTPAYMSPEQADMKGQGVDTRSDIYSLGVVLYELLCGLQPFDAQRLRDAGYEEMLRIIRNEEPMRLDRRIKSLDEGATQSAKLRKTEPAALIRAVSGDLGWIVAKALRKDPERRFASVAEMLADIDRHLDHRPVESRPDSLGYRSSRFILRHRFGVASATLVLAILVAYAITVTLQARALTAERDRVLAGVKKTRQVTTFMIDLFGTADPEYALGESFTARELLDRGAARVSDELANQPELLAPLLTAVGEIYFRLGVYEKSEVSLGEALVAARESNQPEAEGEVLLKLGWTLLEQKKIAGAEPLLLEALTIGRSMVGNEPAFLARVLESVSQLRFEQGDLAEAESNVREGLALLQAEPDQRLAAQLLHQLGVVLMQRSDYAGAETALRQALAERRSILPEAHPEIATNLANLAYLMTATGRYDEAVQLYRETLASYRHVLGDDHPWVGRTMAGLASSLRSSGEFVESEALHRQVLALHSKYLGGAHVEVAMAYNDLGRVIQDQGRLDEAEALYLEALSRYPQDHRWRTATLRNLATVYEARGELVKAANAHRELLASDVATFGMDHDRVAMSEALLGGVLVRLNNNEEAEPMLRHASSIFEDKLPANHPRHAFVLLPLGEILCMRSEFAEAGRHLTRGRELRLQHYGTDDQRTAEADLALGTCLVAEGRTDEALPHLANADRVFRAGQNFRQAEAASAFNALSEGAAFTDRQ